jgi:hypothetical protein
LFSKAVPGVTELLQLLVALKSKQDGVADKGAWMEIVFQISIFLRIILARFGFDGPFSIVAGRKGLGADIAVKYLDADLKDHTTVKEEVLRYIKDENIGKILWLILPKNAQFELFDGFVVFRSSESSDPIFLGFQSKYDHSTVTRAAPDWLAGGILLRGDAEKSPSIITEVIKLE